MFAYKLYGMGLGAGIFAVLAGSAVIDIGYRNANYLPVTAHVVQIDRVCEFEITRAHRFGETDSADCNASGEFEALRAYRDKNSPKIKGKATVRFTYTSPVDHIDRIGQTEFDGLSDEFYSLKRNSTLNIFVDKTDPSKLRGTTPFGVWTEIKN